MVFFLLTPICIPKDDPSITFLNVVTTPLPPSPPTSIDHKTLEGGTGILVCFSTHIKIHISKYDNNFVTLYGDFIRVNPIQGTVSLTFGSVYLLDHKLASHPTDCKCSRYM